MGKFLRIAKLMQVISATLVLSFACCFVVSGMIKRKGETHKKAEHKTVLTRSLIATIEAYAKDGNFEKIADIVNAHEKPIKGRIVNLVKSYQGAITDEELVALEELAKKEGAVEHKKPVKHVKPAPAKLEEVEKLLKEADAAIKGASDVEQAFDEYTAITAAISEIEDKKDDPAAALVIAEKLPALVQEFKDRKSKPPVAKTEAELKADIKALEQQATQDGLNAFAGLDKPTRDKVEVEEKALNDALIPLAEGAIKGHDLDALKADLVAAKKLAGLVKALTNAIAVAKGEAPAPDTGGKAPVPAPVIKPAPAAGGALEAAMDKYIADNKAEWDDDNLPASRMAKLKAAAPQGAMDLGAYNDLIARKIK